MGDTTLGSTLERVRLEDRARRLRLVLAVLNDRAGAHRRAGQAVPVALRESIAGFGAELGEVRRRLAELGAVHTSDATRRRSGRRFARRPPSDGRG